MLFIGHGLELREGLGVPADELDNSPGCIERFIKSDACPSCCNGSDDSSLSHSIRMHMRHLHNYFHGMEHCQNCI